jgi:serine/threonine protein kinase
MSDQTPNPLPEKSSGSSSNGLAGLNPLGLLDGVLGGRSADWEPPSAQSLEPYFPGYSHFSYIDRGGMGAVYSAVQTSLQRKVAIKILPPELVDDEGFMERFQQEAHMLARLQHPHIVAVYDFGITQSGHHFIVMEYVEGVSLLEIIRKEKPSATRALNITAQVCEALSYAHERGIIHRDIKPSNILIDERGLVRVADFGLAKNSLLQGPTTAQHTKGFLGTAGYVAPEQRQKGVTPDHKADIFSLGVTLYEMLTGQLPLGVFNPPSKECGTPTHVDKIIRKALMQNPGDRYQSALEMRTAVAKSLLRMGTPLVQRAIISKPITSMVTCVIVGMGLIYLLDTLNNELLLNRERTMLPLMANERANLQDPASYLTVLNDEWAVMSLKTRWYLVPQMLAKVPGWTFAEIHDERELGEVSQLLQTKQITQPLWIAARRPQDDGNAAFTWLSGQPMDYQAWIGPHTDEPLIITEIQAKNRTTLIAGGETPDWIEVTNVSSTPIDLVGYHLRQMVPQEPNRGYYLQDWIQPDRVPEGETSILQPGERRVLLCSPHASHALNYMFIDFSLEASAARLEWCDPRGHVCQNFNSTWRGFPEDASICLAPDGKRWGWSMKATPGKANSAIQSPFTGPVSGSREEQALAVHPAFGARWFASPQRHAKPALLRRRAP